MKKALFLLFLIPGISHAALKVGDGSGSADGTGNWTAQGSSSSTITGGVGVGISPPAATLHVLGNNDTDLALKVGVVGIASSLQVRNDGVVSVNGAPMSGTAFQIIDGGLALHSTLNQKFMPEIALVKEAYDRDPEFVLVISSDSSRDYLDFYTYSTAMADFLAPFRIATDGKIYVTSGPFLVTGGNVGIGTTAPVYSLDVAGTGRVTSGLTVSSLTVTGTGESYGVIGTTQTQQRFEVNASTPATLYTSTAAVALRTVWDFSGPDVVLGAATNTVISVATAAYNGFVRMDPSISSGPSNGVLYKWRAPDHFNTGVDLVLVDFIHYLGAADTVVSTYTIAINAYAASSERPTSFLLPITFNTTLDASGAARDNESAADTTLTGWAAAITPGAQYWNYLGRNGGDPSTVETYAGELHITGARSGTQ